MKYAIDTEFIEDGKTIDLVSIALVAEDGRAYYAQSVEFDHKKADDWIKENVLKQLTMCPWAEPSKHGIDGLYRADRAYHYKFGGQCIDQQRGFIHNCPWRRRVNIRDEIVAFLDPSKYGRPELYGWCSGSDWVVFYQLFGKMMDLPDSYPHYIRDIQYDLDMHDISDDQLPVDLYTEVKHNALADARYILQLLEWIALKAVRNNEIRYDIFKKSDYPFKRWAIGGD